MVLLTVGILGALYTKVTAYSCLPSSPVLGVRVPDKLLQPIEPLVYSVNERIEPRGQGIKPLVHLRIQPIDLIVQGIQLELCRCRLAVHPALVVLLVGAMLLVGLIYFRWDRESSGDAAEASDS